MKKQKWIGSFVAFVAGILLFSSCEVKPRPLKLGKDNCDYCSMTIMDARFGAELLTKKGRIYVFDDPHCVLAFLHQQTVPAVDIKDIYLVDYCGNHELIHVNAASLFHSEELRSPMGGNIAAFSSADSLTAAMSDWKGNRITWNELVK